MAVLPTQQELHASFPLLWPSWLCEMLPARARCLVDRQEVRCHEQWERTLASGVSLDEEEYTRAWLLVNSRTFYNGSSLTEGYPWEERLALIPLADLFNHSREAGCSVNFSDEGYVVTAVRGNDPGEEMYISYGDYSNDYILAEYGFAVEGRDDEEMICLNDVVFPKARALGLPSSHDGGPVGEYAIDANNGQPCDDLTRNMPRDLREDGGAKDLLEELLQFVKDRINDLAS
ncbi:SET protein [Geosmithia morbida]|uniref:SET protein n=1 Tax=Geosmithia morbida TaxID=1094350 RepID=A0A9P4YRZ3_9HYPO|nr:SET protein [Geosmithia morbida]KAF4119924.1 SET protein [Geosmithia morbida]